MSNPPQVLPGWYPNQHGQLQWWDGHQWGPIAATPAASALSPSPAAAPAYFYPSAVHGAPTSVVVYQRPLKDVGTAYVFAILLGGFGAHRFYLGQIGPAVGILVLWCVGAMLTFVAVGFLMILAALIWWIVDMCSMKGLVHDANQRILSGR